MDLYQDCVDCSPGVKNGHTPGVTCFQTDTGKNASNIFLEGSGPIKAKFHMKPHWVGVCVGGGGSHVQDGCHTHKEGMKVCLLHLVHITLDGCHAQLW